MEEKYIGARKVIGISVVDGKSTPLKNEIIKVTYEDGTSEEMSKKRYDIIATDTVSDATSAGDLIRKEVGSYIYAVMHEYGIKYGEIDAILDQVTLLVNNATEKATNILYGVEHPSERTLLCINDILIKKHESEENTNGSPSDGSGSDSKN